MKKLFLSIISAFMIFSSFSTVFADDYDYYNSSYGTWSYYHISQSNNSTNPDYNEVGLSIGGLSFPIPNYTGAVSLVYQFNKAYSGTLTINYDQSVSSSYKLIYGDYGAKINYSSGNSVNVSITDCTRLEIIVLGSNATKINTIGYSLTESTTPSSIDYSGQLSNIYQVLNYINTTTNSIYSHIDNLEGYVDNLESYVDSVESTLSNIYNNLSNIYNAINTSNTNTSNINSNVSNIYSLLNDLYDYFGNKLTSIINNTDSLESLLSSINNSINILSQTRLSVNTYDIPFYQFMFLNTLTRGDLSLVHFNEYNMPYVLWSDVKNIQKDFYGTGSMYMAYGLSAYNLEFTIDNGSSTTITSTQGLFNRNVFTYLGSFTITGWTSLSFNIPDSCRIYPLYLGRSAGLPIEVSQALGRPYDDTYTQYLADNISVLNTIYSYLSSLNIGDDSQLIAALNDLENAINLLSGSFNVTNNVTVNDYNYTEQEYQFFSMLLNGDFTKVRFDNLGKPFIYASDVNAATKRYYFSNNKPIAFIYATSYYLGSALLTESSITPTVVQGGFSNTYYIYYERVTSSGWKTFTLNYPQNYRIYPIYLGYADNAPESIRSMFPTIYPSIPDIVNNIYNELIGLSDDVNSIANSSYFSSVLSKLDDVIDSINSLDLNFNVDITNQQITNITNDFDTNIEIVNDVEVDFNTSFDSSNQLISDSDLSLNFQNMQPALNLYHDIFSSFYNIDLFKYVLIICLVGGAVLVLLG